MNKDDLRDELPFYQWVLFGKVHLRTALWMLLASLFGYIPLLIIVFKPS